MKNNQTAPKTLREYQRPELEMLCFTAEQGFAGSQPFEGGPAKPLSRDEYSWNDDVFNTSEY